jgi:hypothetical protein
MTLRTEIVNGEEVLVMYMKLDFTPCSPEEAEAVKLTYQDGRHVFAVKDEPAAPEP